MAESEIIDDRYIVNRALARIGSSPINSLDEDTSKARQCKAIYRDAIDALLGVHDWTWSRKLYQLERLAETPQNGWRFVFGLPDTRIGGPRRVLSEPRQPQTPERFWHLEEDRLYADREPIWAQVTVRSAPHVWDPQFRLAAIVAVAAQLAVPIGHDTTLAESLIIQAVGTPSEGGRGGLFGRALSADATKQPVQSPLWQDPLTAARFM